MQAGTLNAPDCWPSTPQALYNEMFAKGAAQMNQIEGVVISDSTPSAENRDKAWFKINAGNPVGWFLWSTTYSQWLRPHDYPANGSVRILWVGLEADLSTFDGGDAGPAGIASGPMWEVDHEFDGRSPMGPGSIPSSSSSITVATNFGEGTHLQTMDEVATHTHAAAMDGINLTSPDSGKFCAGQNTGVHANANTLGNNFSSSTMTQQRFNVVHPVRGCFIIKRTATRQYYRG